VEILKRMLFTGYQQFSAYQKLSIKHIIWIQKREQMLPAIDLFKRKEYTKKIGLQQEIKKYNQLIINFLWDVLV
jgi:hypothetical protein